MYESDCYALAEKIVQSRQSYDLIIAVARGGLAISRYLSDSLQLPIASCTIQSYQNMQQGSQIAMTYDIGGEVRDKRILLVDDICDTGKTFVFACEHLRTLGAARISTASLFFKKTAIVQPDFALHEATAWIIFPYEKQETLRIWTAQYGIEQANKRAVLFSKL
jgi:hypoxanthine phosphoribosyltransferase